MITRDNLKEVINQLPENRKRAIKSTRKEYIVLELHVFNSGSFTTCIITNNFDRYKNVSNYGNCILYAEDVIKLID